MTSAALCPVHALAAEIAARRLSPVDLVDECVARIERLEPRLHAFVSVNAANARLAAGGLPTSLQIVCRAYAEPLALRIGYAYQAAHDWHLRVPPMAA